MPVSPLFNLQDRKLSYAQLPVLAVDSLSINKGEKVALVGSSGSGKSTLLRALYAQQAETIAYCPQDLGLVPALSCFHNIYMGSLQRHNALYNVLNLIAPRTKEREAIAKIATELGLSDKLRDSVDQLSGGQQQRTALGRALFQQADTFLGDEPLSAVDELQSEALLELIIARHETVIIALHDRNLALKHFDRIIGLDQGRILLDTSAASLSEADLNSLYQDN